MSESSSGDELLVVVYQEGRWIHCVSSQLGAELPGGVGGKAGIGMKLVPGLSLRFGRG